MERFFHSVTLDESKCKGCINCIKRCPTEAIRVRNGKATILAHRCIDCGECIRVCPHHAKRAICDKLSDLSAYQYKIALPAPSFYGQFNNLEDVDILLSALKDMGFDQVFEVSRAAELVSDCTRRMMRDGLLKLPVISSACPAVVRLIRVRFPKLIDHVLPLNAPMELAARMAKLEAAEKTGLPMEQIGAVFISPCAAKVTAVKMPLGARESAVDAVVAISEVYPKILSYMKHVQQPEELAKSGKIGVGWADSGGEAAALLGENYLAADGIENVIRVLESLEDEKFQNLEFVELDACSGGCVGGILTVENPYLAKTKLKRLKKYLPVSCNHLEGGIPPDARFDVPLEYSPVLKLGTSFKDSFQKLSQMEQITQELPGLDCGSCGSPTCQALAEDIVQGYATELNCIHLLKERLSTMASQMVEMAEATRE